MTTELPKEFVSATAAVNGTTLHYVRGGQGPALVLIHGFPQDWFEYHSIMPRLAQRFTVIAVDLRGVGGRRRRRAATMRPIWRRTSMNWFRRSSWSAFTSSVTISAAW